MDGCDNGGRSSAGRVPGCDPGCRGFESHRPPHQSSGPLAQLVEQETLNLLVVGSIPTRPTKSLEYQYLAGAIGCLRQIRLAAAPRLVLLAITTGARRGELLSLK